MQAVLKKNEDSAALNGLDTMMSRLKEQGLDCLGDSFEYCVSQALAQLEQDDRFGPTLTDYLAESLELASDLPQDSAEFHQALHLAMTYYYNGVAAQNLECAWVKRLENLSKADMDTTLWRDLNRAVEAAKTGRDTVVERWVELAERRLLDALEKYESLRLADDEITTESVLLHRFLQAGVECWLEALALFSENSIDEGVRKIIELAEQGQRYLVGVQVLNKEVKASSLLRLANFN